MNNEENRNVQVPIKDIVNDAMINNGAKYEEDEFNLLRKYFIACLNLGYIEPTSLTLMVNKFASKIKLISLNYNQVNKMDYYIINNGVLYINGALKDTESNFYELNYYKAVTETILGTNDKHIGISSAICDMIAERVYNMDVNSSRIIMPRTDEEVIGSEKIQVRTGYSNYNLVISLAKQLFINHGINENKLFKTMFIEGYEKVLSETFNTSNDALMLDVLDKICIMYIERKVRGNVNPAEKQLIDKYQIILNDTFKTIDQNYFAFCALITTDELRKKCMMKLSNEGE